MHNFCKSTITDEEFKLLKESGFFDIPQFFRYTWKEAHRFDKRLIEIAEKAITNKGGILRQPLTGYKKVLYKSSSGYRECVAKLIIPEKAVTVRPHSSKKYRTNIAYVESIKTILDNKMVNEAHSIHTPQFIYTAGKNVRVRFINKDLWNICARGIHFFLTEKEAVEYEYH